MTNEPTDTAELKWTLSALDISPRLHVHLVHPENGQVRITSTDDQLLYLWSDARALSNINPLSAGPADEQWRCFLHRGKSERIIAEVRRDIHRESAVGISIYKTSLYDVEAEFKTGLVVRQVGSKWQAEYRGRTYYVLQAYEAPNTSSSARARSYKLTDHRGAPLAWYACEDHVTQAANPGTWKQAILWFEPAVIDGDLVDFVVTSLLAAADVMMPFLRKR
jgi:hypothetical protein